MDTSEFSPFPPRNWHSEGMSSRSAKIAAQRPFYASHADAYDALITDSATPWVTAVQEILGPSNPGVTRVLDAGCGTGRHAQALIELGYSVSLLDASADLLAIARERCPSASATLGDICGFTTRFPFDAITCRGVLNDLVTDQERADALMAFANALKPGGMLILDVREAEGSEVRADGRTRRAEVDLKSGGHLRFASTPHWGAGLIEVTETYELTAPSGTSAAHHYRFQMRPWTRQELQQRLDSAGFSAITISAGVGRTTPDRLLVVARVAPET